MQKLKIALVAATIALSSFLGAFAPQVAKADNHWPVEVLVSSAQARFEAKPLAYDATTNKYKYWFSWLIPARRTYSFKIDGRIYNPSVTKNGVAETPFWFSPDITYTIQIFPYANGRGAMIAEGSFKAPSVAAAPVKQPLTAEEEMYLLGDYAYAAPEIPKKTMKKNSMDVGYITNLIESTFSLATVAETKPYLSSTSIEFLDQAPLFVKELDTPSDNYELAKALDYRDIKVYQGGQYASFSYKLRNITTRKSETAKLIFIKENGQWKIDYIQTLIEAYDIR